MDQECLLSICIPTFNRGEYLKQSLDILLPQLKNYKSIIEILISDNCSTDNTKNIVEGYCRTSQFPLQYSRNETNIGGNANFISLINKSKGKYIYVLGDDDVISPQFIDIILPFLYSNRKYDLLHFNRLSGNAECDDNTLFDSHYCGNAIEELTPEMLLKRVWNGPNFISSVIIKKSIVNFEDIDNPRYLGYNLFRAVIMGVVKSNGLSLYYYFPLVIQRNPYKTWIYLWPQYCISSMNNIYEEIDGYIPGIYLEWKKRWHKEMKKALPQIMDNREYYRQNHIKNLMIRHLTFYEHLKMNFYLFFPYYRYLFRCKGKLLYYVQKLLS